MLSRAKSFLFLCSLALAIAFNGCQFDSIAQTDTAPPDSVSAVLFVCGFLAVVAAILAIIGISGGIIAILILFGVISSSIFAGWVTKRPTFGLRTFMAQIFALGALPLGIAATWGIVKLNHWHLPFWKILLNGGISGVIAGLALAFALDFLIRFIFKRVFKESTPVKRAELP